MINIQYSNNRYLYNKNREVAFRQSYPVNSKQRKLGLAAASAAIPGLGQIINGETTKGFTYFLLGLCNYALCFRLLKKNIPGYMIAGGIRAVSAKDAYDKG